MKIKKLNITSYGKFENREITFSDGLNIVYGKNEAGKSTVLSFIRAMLYGFSGRGGVSSNDRKHYLPWGKSSMQGSADILLDNGKVVKVSRTSGKSQGFDRAECFDISNSESYDFSPEKEVLCGEDAFLKTLCIKQLQTPISGETDEISGKLINLTQTAAEDISAQKSEAIITDYMKKFKALRGEKGLIFDLQNQIADINVRIAAANRKRLDVFEQIKQKNELGEKISACKDKLAFIKQNMECVKQSALFKKLDEVSAKKAELSKKLSSLKEEIESKSTHLASLSVFSEDAPEQMFTPATETDSIKAEIKNVEKHLSLLNGGCIALLLSALLSAFLIFIHPSLLILPFTLSSGTVLAFLKKGKIKKELSSLNEVFENTVLENNKINELLSRFGVNDIREYAEKKSLYTALSAELSAYKKQLLETEGDFSLLNEEEKELSFKTASLQRPETLYTEAELSEEEEALSSILHTFIAESSKIDGALSESLGEETIDILIAERANLIKKLDNAKEEYEAAQLALSALSDIFSEMRSDFTPLINQKASEYLGKLTGGSIDKIYVDKKFSVNAETDSVKELAYFSLGTIDQTYLAIRLSIIDLLFGKDKPIFIDDAFLQYDTQREEAAFNLLSERAWEGQQIIFFTCRPIPKLSVDINMINLDNEA